MRGVALTTVLFVMVAVLLAAFSMAALASFNYNLARQAQLSTEALEAAHSGLACAMSVLVKTPAWGANATDVLPETTIDPTVSGAGSDPTHFDVVFQARPGLPASVNNLAGSGRISGPPDPANHNQPRQIPAHAALLFVEGTAGQGSQVQRRILESIVEFPPSSYAMLASNSIVSWDSVSGYHGVPGPTTAVTVDGQTGLDSANASTAANIFAGGQWDGDLSGVRYSVFLAPYSTVQGTVNAADSSTNVVAATPAVSAAVPEAQAVSAADLTQQIPNIDISSYNNASTANPITIDSQGRPVVSGNVYASSPGTRLVLGSGPDQQNGPDTPVVPLILNNGTLYVDGDVEIPGGIVGAPDSSKASGYDDANGSIYVNGEAWICVRRYDPALYSGDGIAIFSQKDLNLYPVGWNGTGSQTGATVSGVPIICGSMYTHSNINFAQGIHVYGSLVADGSAGNGNIFMAQGGHITYVPVFSQFAMTSGKGGSAGASHMLILYCREVAPAP